jgi:CRISPR/Cas system CSM-associated protein Csm3 (group 7 of RAMP superfamily)
MMEHLFEFELARITIEAQSPFVVACEGSDAFYDAAFTTDANGLPAIPGETLAGVLRHALAAFEDSAEASTADRASSRAFGYQERQSGASSRVETSWAHCHDKSNRPVPFRGASIKGDPVLEFLARGVGRDHVRIDANGVADQQGRGKFDELLVPAGARFTFEARILAGANLDISDLIAFFALPELRIGRASRRGLGEFRVVKCLSRKFDLRNAKDREDFAKLPVDLHTDTNGVLSEHCGQSTRFASRWTATEIELSPESTWSVGGALEPRGLLMASERSFDRFPWAEERIVWTNDEGRLGALEWLLPASTLKGLLRHRVAFHARRLGGQFYDPADPASLGAALEVPAAEIFWFGTPRDNAPPSPGRIRLGDVRLKADKKQAAFDHVSIDRFTQGPIDGRLFREVTLFKGGPLKVALAVDLGDASEDLIAPLRAALEDLCSGRLALGAASSRGHGKVRGNMPSNMPLSRTGGAK